MTSPAGPPSDAACKLVSWDDLPAEVRSASRPEPVGDADPVQAACRLDNSILAVISGLPPRGSLPRLPEATSLPNLTSLPPLPDIKVDTSNPQYFFVRLSIGPQVRTSPGSYDNPEDVEVGGSTGVRSRGVTESTGVPFCVVAFRGERTKAAVAVVNTRFPAVEACAVALDVARRVAPRLP